MAKRSPQQQTKHDKGVQSTAKYYESQGYKVEADISGFNAPSTLNSRRPDVIAKKGSKKVIIEVETKDSAEKDRAQQEVFERYADSHKGVRFIKKIV